MDTQLKSYLEQIVECCEGALAYSGQSYPLWTALENAKHQAQEAINCGELKDGGTE